MQNSYKLQVELFLKPDCKRLTLGQHARINPLLILDHAWVINMPSWIPWLSQPDAFHRKEASWRRMFLAQPADQIEFKEIDTDCESTFSVARIGPRLETDDIGHLRMGFLVGVRRLPIILVVLPPNLVMVTKVPDIIWSLFGRPKISEWNDNVSVADDRFQDLDGDPGKQEREKERPESRSLNVASLESVKQEVPVRLPFSSSIADNGSMICTQTEIISSCL
ncbi:hypothetical protein BDW62DRAFT_170120 [Aspergillus aurantiobrunneus]